MEKDKKKDKAPGENTNSCFMGGGKILVERSKAD